MRTIAIGDIHGGLKALNQLLKLIEPTRSDTLIFLGDYVDGWSHSAQVIELLLEIEDKYNCIFIRGNHDIWCENWLRTGDSDRVWLDHGGVGTKESYQDYSEEEKKKHLQFFERMLPYFIDDENRLYIHAGFTSMHGVEKEFLTQQFYFDRTLWEMALTMDKQIDKNSNIYPPRLKHYKEIYIGHTPTLNYGKYEPMFAINVIDVDTGAAFYGKLSAIDVDTKKVWQTDKVWDFYPDEQGRNKAPKPPKDAF